MVGCDKGAREQEVLRGANRTIRYLLLLFLLGIVVARSIRERGFLLMTELVGVTLDFKILIIITSYFIREKNNLTKVQSDFITN